MEAAALILDNDSRGSLERARVGNDDVQAGREGTCA